MRRYAIADYLTDEQKRRACAGRYRARPRNRRLRDSRGCCPLGRALDEVGCAPVPSRVASAIIAPRPITEDWDTWTDIADAASEFIWAWETGALTPGGLAEALGVAP